MAVSAVAEMFTELLLKLRVKQVGFAFNSCK